MDQPTKLLYLQDSYQKTATATIQKVEQKGSQTTIVLDQTILYPQGGGQPADQGLIIGPNGQLAVSHVSYSSGRPTHMGTLTGELKVGDEVQLELDWPVRYQHMQWHTAGHLLDEAVRELYPGAHGIEGEHGIGKKLSVTFNVLFTDQQFESIQAKINQIIANNEPITFRMVTKKDIDTEGIELPFKLPENKPLRLIKIGQRPEAPDGGTQLQATGEAWPITLTQLDRDPLANTSTIHYQVATPDSATNIPASPKSEHPSIKQNTFYVRPVEPSSEMLVTMPPNIKELNKKILQEFSTLVSAAGSASLSASNIQSLNDIRNQYTGKKGLLNTAFQEIIKDSEDKKALGQQFNAAKKQIEATFDARYQALSSQQTFLDLTAPGELPTIGRLHPVTQAIEEVADIFEKIGFIRVRYPEVDWDWYAFEALNFPDNHPARDDWETFWINTPEHPHLGSMLLTPHTSSGQVREMERVNHQPPIRMINIAKCYRRQQDVTHTNMFHQFEGLVVDKGINIQHLKGTIDYFAREFYGPHTKSRIRPYNFRFTEPSFEVDFSCGNCEGTGKLTDGSRCRFCKSGWHEVGGAGMVHPNVLRAGGIDPEMYTGFAFGWGIERTYTLKPGLKLDDIRLLYNNNIEFLKQF